MDQRTQLKTRYTVVDRREENGPDLTGTRNNFLHRTLLAQTLRLTINKWNIIKPRSFCTAKNAFIQTKWQPTE